MDRRAFLRDAARVLLVLPLGTFLIACEEDKGPATGSSPTEPDPTPPDAPPRVEGSNLVYTSSQTNVHSHSFRVPAAAFDNPPFGGIIGNTTPAQGHSHRLDVTQEAIRRAAAGEIVKIPTSKELDHTHTFTILKL